MADPAAPVSPTGRPLVPAALVPYLLALGGLAAVVATLAEAGIFGAQSVLVAKLAEGVVAMAGLATGASPGLRAKAPDAGAAAAAAVSSGPAAVDAINAGKP